MLNRSLGIHFHPIPSYIDQLWWCSLWIKRHNPWWMCDHEVKAPICCIHELQYSTTIFYAKQKQHNIIWTASHMTMTASLVISTYACTRGNENRQMMPCGIYCMDHYHFSTGAKATAFIWRARIWVPLSGNKKSNIDLVFSVSILRKSMSHFRYSIPRHGHHCLCMKRTRLISSTTSSQMVFILSGSFLFVHKRLHLHKWSQVYCTLCQNLMPL